MSVEKCIYQEQLLMKITFLVSLKLLAISRRYQLIVCCTFARKFLSGNSKKGGCYTTNFYLIGNARIKAFEFPGYQVSKLPCFFASRLLFFWVPRIPSFLFSFFQGFWASGFSGVQASEFPAFRASMFPGF